MQHPSIAEDALRVIVVCKSNRQQEFLRCLLEKEHCEVTIIDPTQALTKHQPIDADMIITEL